MEKLTGNIKIKQALEDTIMVTECNVQEQKRESGIILPETAKEEWVKIGRVAHCGPGKLLDNGDRAAMPCKPGDLVCFDRYTRTCHGPDGVTYRIVPRHEVFAIVEVSK